MKRFTLFTFLYLATGICLTAIALQYPDMTPNAKASLLVSSGLLYLRAVFTTFPFWHQSVQRSQARLRDRPAWQQNFVAIAPWLVIASVLVSALAVAECLPCNSLPEVIADVQSHNLTIGVLANLPLIFLSVENLFVRNQNRNQY